MIRPGDLSSTFVNGINGINAITDLATTGGSSKTFKVFEILIRLLAGPKNVRLRNLFEISISFTINHNTH